MANKKQKWSIMLASAIIFLDAGLLIYSTISTALLGSTFALSMGIADLSAYVTTISTATLIMGVLIAILGYLLWIHKQGAWWIASLLAILSLLSGIWGLTTISVLGFIELGLGFVLLYALAVKESRKACGVKL
jgi:hypothetical protein